MEYLYFYEASKQWDTLYANFDRICDIAYTYL
jgi:hypothetical protein